MKKMDIYPQISLWILRHWAIGRELRDLTWWYYSVLIIVLRSFVDSCRAERVCSSGHVESMTTCQSECQWSEFRTLSRVRGAPTFSRTSLYYHSCMFIHYSLGILSIVDT